MSQNAPNATAPNARWWILAFVSLLMFGNYYVYDAVGPVAEQLQRELGFSDTQIGTLNAIYSLPNIFLVLIGGLIVDRFGRRALSMVFGSLLLPLSFVGLVMGEGGLWVTTVLLGISFSLVPAVLWPSVIKLVEAERLGTAYGLLFMLQAVGMSASNLIAGWLNDHNSAGSDNPAGYGPMILFFALLAVGALVFSFALWRRETGSDSHGLELPG